MWRIFQGRKQGHAALRSGTGFFDAPPGDWLRRDGTPSMNARFSDILKFLVSETKLYPAQAVRG
ncbi:hypothetical protein BCAR13_100181 [Paraburkholderia caribensis]|nr:hypothetical protein BCAR13_100181 [Paraburkholderia caribensis]